MLKVKSRKLRMKKKGFSIGEVVISAFIVSVALVAIVNLIVGSLKHSMDSRDHIIASQLAQEGVELVRNIRDNSWATGGGSFDDLPNGTNNNCRIDKNSTQILPGDCNDVPNSKILNYSAANFYVHSAGTQTKFQRKIELDDTSGNMDVQSIVIWGSDFPALANCNVGNKCVYTQSVLTRWGE